MNGKAYEQWVIDFMENNSVVSVIKTQATSVTSFNSFGAEELFTKYSDFRKKISSVLNSFIKLMTVGSLQFTQYP